MRRRSCIVSTLVAALAVNLPLAPGGLAAASAAAAAVTAPASGSSAPAATSAAPTPSATGASATSTATGAPAAPGRSDRVPAVVIALGLLGALLVLTSAAWGVAHWVGWQPRWREGLGHVIAEAGFHLQMTWAEFADWVRLGR